MTETPITLQPGDVLCVAGDMALVSAGIRLIERVWAKDNEARYGHSAIVGTAGGTLLDTLWRVRWTHISRYAGQQMVIARPTRTLRGIAITEAARRVSLNMVSADGHGRLYPVHRLALHLLPPLAKYCTGGRQMVCSERTAKYLRLIGAMADPWAGITPDDLADRWRRWSNFDVLFEGVWPDGQ